jgi:hypothetical protein
MLLIFSIVTVICTSTVCVLVAVQIRKNVSDAFLALERHEARNERQVNMLLNRLMTIRWEDFAAIEAIEDAEEEGGQVIPTRRNGDGDEAWVDDGKWGVMSTLRERLRLLDEEEQIVDEDFDEHGNPRPTGVA